MDKTALKVFVPSYLVQHATLQLPFQLVQFSYHTSIEYLQDEIKSWSGNVGVILDGSQVFFGTEGFGRNMLFALYNSEQLLHKTYFFVMNSKENVRNLSGGNLSYIWEFINYTSRFSEIRKLDEIDPEQVQQQIEATTNAVSKYDPNKLKQIQEEIHSPSIYDTFNTKMVLSSSGSKSSQHYIPFVILAILCIAIATLSYYIVTHEEQNLELDRCSTLREERDNLLNNYTMAIKANSTLTNNIQQLNTTIIHIEKKLIKLIREPNVDDKKVNSTILLKNSKVKELEENQKEMGSVLQQIALYEDAKRKYELCNTKNQKV